MSGIAAIIRLDGQPVEKQLIEKMTAAMEHRGPDGISHWVDGNIAFGHCLLQTTPQSLFEEQPLVSGDGKVVLVLDGRIDNRSELIEALTLPKQDSDSSPDSRLVLAAYEKWGTNCVHQLEGDFAFVIWDQRLKKVFCARDRMGNRSIYFHWNGSTLAVATEQHAVLSMPWVPQELNEGFVAECLAAEWYYHDETFWRGIHRMMPAQRLTITAKRECKEIYWRPDCSKALPFSTVEAFAERYTKVLSSAVARCCRSHKPVACEVSGGLDSSALFAVAEKLRQAGRLPAPGLEGYCFDFQGNEAANEIEYSRAVGGYLVREIHEIPPSRMPLAWFRESANGYRLFPAYPNGVISIGIRRAAQASGSRVLLVGVGGDEWLGGSRRYYAEALADWNIADFLKLMCDDTAKLGFRTSLHLALRYGLLSVLPGSWQTLIRRAALSLRQHAVTRDDWLTPRLKHILQQRRAKYGHVCVDEACRIGQQEQVRMLSNGYSLFVRELEEQMAARDEIELRWPLLDRRIVEFAFAVPAKFRFDGHMDRFVHRVAMKGYLPERVLRRTSKANFMISFYWYIAELRQELAKPAHRALSKWVSLYQLDREFEDVGKIELGGWPELMIWTAFGVSLISKSSDLDVGRTDMHLDI